MYIQIYSYKYIYIYIYSSDLMGCELLASEQDGITQGLVQTKYRKSCRRPVSCHLEMAEEAVGTKATGP